MKNKNILKLIKESKKLLSNATPEQKQRIIKMLETAKDRIDSANELELSKVTDPDLQRMMDFAKKHYPSSPTKMQAFLKYVQKSLQHSEEDDRRQDSVINMLGDKLRDVETKVTQSNNALTESDYLQEK